MMPYFSTFILTFVSLFPAAECGNADYVHEFITSFVNDTQILRAYAAPSWVDAPYTRGTSNILLSCIVTMIACVYTAVHPNVVVTGGGKWSSIAKKAHNVLLTIFVPEIMLWTALQQFRRAKSLKKSLEGIIDEQVEAGISQNLHKVS